MQDALVDVLDMVHETKAEDLLQALRDVGYRKPRILSDFTIFVDEVLLEGGWPKLWKVCKASGIGDCSISYTQYRLHTASELRLLKAANEALERIKVRARAETSYI